MASVKKDRAAFLSVVRNGALSPSLGGELGTPPPQEEDKMSELSLEGQYKDVVR